VGIWVVVGRGGGEIKGEDDLSGTTTMMKRKMMILEGLGVGRGVVGGDDAVVVVGWDGTMICLMIGAVMVST
jgi:hypothetical protein